MSYSEALFRELFTRWRDTGEGYHAMVRAWRAWRMELEETQKNACPVATREVCL